MATAKRSQPRRFWLSRSCAPRPMPVGAGPVVPRGYLDLHYRFDAAVHLPQERRRLEVAADPNPRLTPARRRQLADDPHWIVRGAARERMGA